MRVTYCYKVFIFIIIGISLLIDNKNFAKADSYEDFYEPDYDSLTLSINDLDEISELIKTDIKAETKMLEAKFHSQIELMKAKCLSESDIIELIKSNIGSDKIGSANLVDCPVDNPLFRIVDGTCLRYSESMDFLIDGQISSFCPDQPGG